MSGIVILRFDRACTLGFNNPVNTRHTLLLLLLLLLLLYDMDVSVTDISSRYFSRTSSDPHRSRFKLHTAVLSVLRVMIRV